MSSPGAVDGRRLRWAEHRAARRAAFVEAGMAAVDRHGPSASAEQMAEVAEVNRTVLYRFFADRNDLRQAVADRIVEQVVGAVLPMLVPNADSTPRDVITSTAATIIAWFDEHPNYYAFLRNEHSLGVVETTLADRIAALLQGLLQFFGATLDEAEPGAYGIVGYVEASCAWWLTHRDDGLSRERFTQTVCDAIWHLLDGVARSKGIEIGYDEPLPFAALTGEAHG